MPWFKVDDQLHSHKKAMRAGTQAMGLWLLAGSWCADQMTDGFVPDRIVARLGSVDLAQRLVDAGLWSKASGGYRFVESSLWCTSEDRESMLWAETKLLERDGWACASCHATCAGLQIDHVVPWSRGGSDRLTNLRWLCPPCNRDKGAKFDYEWEGAGGGPRLNPCRDGRCSHRQSDRALRVDAPVDRSAVGLWPGIRLLRGDI